MILTPAQNKIAASFARFRVVNCGRRFGKTTLAVEEMKGRAVSRPSRIAYLAPTFQQARDIAWELIKKELSPIANTVNESRLEIRVKTAVGGESIIMLRGWEAVETLRGQQFDFMVIDEIASMRNWESNWQEVIRPTLTDTKGEVLFISTPKGFNHFYKLFGEETKDQDYKSFHFTSYDNPHIPIEELEKAKVQMTPDRFAQEYMADFRKTEGLVYKEFDRKKHLFSDYNLIRRTVQRLVGLDFGYTNPTAALVIDRDGDDNYWVRSEWYKTKKTNDEVVEYVKTLGGNIFYPDPAEPDRIEQMRRAGLNCREVSKDIEKGIDSVRNLFLQNKLFIHESCESLIFELETYHYPEKKPDRNENELPVDEDNHAVDALRYVLHMQKPIGSGAVAKQFIPSNLARGRARKTMEDFGDMWKTSAELETNKKRKTFTHYPRSK